MKNYFSSNLKYLRLRHNDTQKALAYKINDKIEDKTEHIHFSSIGRWENEDREPSMLNVIRVANAYNIPIADMVCKDLRINETNKFKEKQLRYDLLKKTLSEKGYMKENEDLTDEDFAKFIELLNIIKK